MWRGGDGDWGGREEKGRSLKIIGQAVSSRLACSLNTMGGQKGGTTEGYEQEQLDDAAVRIDENLPGTSAACAVFITT